MIGTLQLIERNRSGQQTGLPSFCTANEYVLRAILSLVSERPMPVVIEATCNQVNQDGGYTGMQPTDFMHWLGKLAAQYNVPMDRIIVGGDHLGPNPWRKEPAAVAMQKAKELVKLYVEAGFRKIHLDASMPLGGETALSFEQIAERAAELCSVADRYAPNPNELIYVIGTEVPIPGGETEEPDALDVTSVPRFHETICTHRDAFERHGLGHIWPQVVSVVTQPGVDFGHTSVYRFDPIEALALSDAILAEEHLSFEAHSTDYQPTEALGDLVKSHFFFLKVGPELTFRFREAVFSLAGIEKTLNFSEPSHLLDIIDAQMESNDGYWREYYRGSTQEQALLKNYSYSDRIRYYWTDTKVTKALEKLLENLRSIVLTETLVSQFFSGFEFGEIPNTPDELIERQVQKCVRRYYAASGFKF